MNEDTKNYNKLFLEELEKLKKSIRSPIILDGDNLDKQIILKLGLKNVPANISPGKQYEVVYEILPYRSITEYYVINDDVGRLRLVPSDCFNIAFNLCPYDDKQFDNYFEGFKWSEGNSSGIDERIFELDKILSNHMQTLKDAGIKLEPEDLVKRALPSETESIEIIKKIYLNEKEDTLEVLKTTLGELLFDPEMNVEDDKLRNHLKKLKEDLEKE